MFFLDKGVDVGGMSYWYHKSVYVSPLRPGQVAHGTLYNLPSANQFAAKLNNSSVDLGEWATDHSDVSREDALAFAKDVADGLIVKISEWLEKRSENSARHETTLVKALEA